MNIARTQYRRRFARKANRASRGYFLIEFLVYIAVLTVVSGIALSAFYRFLSHSRDVARNTDDIVRTLRAGELWRADIREAVAPPAVTTDEDVTTFEIPKVQDQLVVYLFSEGAVWRMDTNGAVKQVLPRVKASTMVQDHGERVTSWRWELELSTRKKAVRVRPLFTFQAVPQLP